MEDDEAAAEREAALELKDEFEVDVEMRVRGGECNAKIAGSAKWW